jgi:hypothetical protein
MIQWGEIIVFTLKWTNRAKTTYDELKGEAEVIGKKRTGKQKGTSRREGIFKQVNKAIRLLADNPRHPGLQTHEFTSMPNPYDQGQKVFEAYAQNQTPGAYRVFWCYGPGAKEITIIAITPHP